MAEKVYERTLEETPTWAVAVVCFVLLAISIFIEHLIHLVGEVINMNKVVLYCLLLSNLQINLVLVWSQNFMKLFS